MSILLQGRRIAAASMAFAFAELHTLASCCDPLHGTAEMRLHVVSSIESRASVARNRLVFGTTYTTWKPLLASLQQSSRNLLWTFRRCVTFAEVFRRLRWQVMIEDPHSPTRHAQTQAHDKVPGELERLEPPAF